jgi:hypothetical protein
MQRVDALIIRVVDHRSVFTDVLPVKTLESLRMENHNEHTRYSACSAVRSFDLRSNSTKYCVRLGRSEKERFMDYYSDLGLEVVLMLIRATLSGSSPKHRPVRAKRNLRAWSVVTSAIELSKNG